MKLCLPYLADGRIALPPVALCSPLHGAPGDTTLPSVSRVQIGELFRARSLALIFGRGNGTLSLLSFTYREGREYGTPIFSWRSLSTFWISVALVVMAAAAKCHGHSHAKAYQCRNGIQGSLRHISGNGSPVNWHRIRKNWPEVIDRSIHIRKWI